MIDAATLDRFWAKVDRRGVDDCWPWLAAKSRKGYGLFYLSGKTVSAPRACLMIAGVVQPSDKPLACHSCDNPPCCNPAHLWWGSHFDNVADCAAKGRRAKTIWSRGHRNPKAKLTPEAVTEIVAASGSSYEIAAAYGVNATTIQRIRNGTGWTDVTSLGGRP